jgi:hypothetical protein
MAQSSENNLKRFILRSRFSNKSKASDRFQSIRERTVFLFTFSDFNQPIGLLIYPNQSQTSAGNFLDLADRLFAGTSTYSDFEAHKIHHFEHNELFTSTEAYR